MITCSKKWLVIVLTAILVGGLMPGYGFAANSTETFKVVLSNERVESSSQISFNFSTGSARLAGGKSIKVIFPKTWKVPKTINKNDVVVNGYNPDVVSVSGTTFTVKTPSAVGGNTDLRVEVKETAGLLNPDKEGDYVIKVTAQLNEPYIKNGKLDEKPITTTFKSEPVIIEAFNSTLPENANPYPNISPETETGSNEVIVRIGSTIGYTKKMKSNKESVKVGKLDAAPYLSNNYTMVPFKYIADGLDAVTGYDAKTGIVGVYIDNTYMEFQAGVKHAVISGLPVEMPIAPEIKEGRLMLPLKFLVEQLGAKLTWFGDTQTILITK